MIPVYIHANNIYSPIGSNTQQNFAALLAGESGIQLHQKKAIHPQPFYAALIADIPFIAGADDLSRFERLVIHSINDALAKDKVDLWQPDTLLILSTTKGNIEGLEHPEVDAEKLTLHYTANRIGRHFNCKNRPLVISNACISGITALVTGMRLIQSGQYRQVVVTGADTISAFVFSGFNAFQAISPIPCRPYDVDRNGVSLGEAAATMVLSAEKGESIMEICGGAGSNDANHISGPSRTGAELNMAMNFALQQAGLKPNEIDFICSHGTATVFNDEMESKAINLAGLQNVPVMGLKGYYGHTLGAAGLLETVLSVECMRNQTLLATKGFKQLGVPMPINVQAQNQSAELRTCLKTASGFGGCNAALVIKKLETINQ